MTTYDDLLGRVLKMRDKYGISIELKESRKRYYIIFPLFPHLNSSNMNLKTMMDWLDAFETGLIIGARL